MLTHKVCESTNPTTRIQDLEHWFPRSNNTGLITTRRGNLTGLSVGYRYNSLGRLESASTAGSGGWGTLSVYDPNGQRVYASEYGVPDGTKVYFYGIDGTMLAAYAPMQYGGQTYMLEKKRYVCLGNRTIAEWRSASTDYGPVKLLLLDRLSSENPQGSEEAYPYGEPKAATADTYATYKRSPLTSLYYARNRQYASNYGRFTSADPYQASAGLTNPGSWNRYSCVVGNPINYFDPPGLLTSSPDGDGDGWIPDFTVTGTGYADPTPYYYYPLYWGDKGLGGSGTDLAVIADPVGFADTRPPTPRPECDRSIIGNKLILDFIGAHVDDAQKLAQQLGVPVQYLLGVAGAESAHGDH